MKLTKDILKSINYGDLQNCPESFDTAAEIDSRKLKKGMIFFALKGEKTDGHNFVNNTLEKAPAFCVVEKNWYKDKSRELQKSPLWIVENSETALQKLATKVREISNIPVLALTGTNGKTSTRSMITAVLSKKFRILSTIGNMNNHLGLPLSILRLESNHDFAVLEMGTNHFGEINFLCDIAKPNFGLITNIGRGHTEFLKNLEGVAKAKEELFLAIPKEGTVFINDDDKLIKKMNCPSQSRITYGFDATNPMYKGEILGLDSDGKAKIKINEQTCIQLNISGICQSYNALVAFCIGNYFKINPIDIKEALEKYKGVSNRFGITKSRFNIINDTYNANPESTLSAINTLSEIKTSQKKYFILGNMLELGSKAAQYHAEMGEAIAKTDIDYFFAYGDLAFHATNQATKFGHINAIHFKTKQEIISLLNQQLNDNDVVLAKGSRGSKMEEILEGIKE